MSSWGASFRSCDSLLARLEQNDPTLQDLVILSTKSFGDAEVARLVKILESQSNSYWRSLSASGQTVSNESLCQLGQAIGKQNVMTSLAIGNKDMGDEGIIALCDGLATAQDNPLTDIDLSYKGVRRKGFMRILETFGTSRILRRLNLSRNPGICICRLRLCEELTQENLLLFENVEHLDLSDCNIDNDFVEDMLALMRATTALSLRLDNNPNITRTPATHGDQIAKLYMSGCRVDDAAMEKLCALNSPSLLGLVELDLAKNAITSAGATSLASAIFSMASTTSYLPNLETIDLSGNKLSDSGALALVTALETRGKLVANLDLSQSGIGATGAVAAVLGNQVASLRLFDNQLGSDGFDAIARAITNSSKLSLTSLDLSGNAASASAVTELLKSLLNTSAAIQLTTLVIGGNGSDGEVESTVALMKAKYPALDIARDKTRQTTR